MRKSLVTGAIGGGAAVVIAVVLLFAYPGPTVPYSLYVDARTETGDGVSESHVTILNSGSSVLTNIQVNYDGGQTDKIPLLKPGDKVILSPPSSSKTVTVTDDQGLTVTKPFSEFNE